MWESLATLKAYSCVSRDTTRHNKYVSCDLQYDFPFHLMSIGLKSQCALSYTPIRRGAASPLWFISHAFHASTGSIIQAMLTCRRPDTSSFPGRKCDPVLKYTPCPPSSRSCVLFSTHIHNFHCMSFVFSHFARSSYRDPGFHTAPAS